MPEIIVSEQTYTRLVEFKPVIEAVLEREISLDRCIEFILGIGIDSTLRSLMESMDQISLLRVFQVLGSMYPKQVYPYITESVRQGANVRQREAMKRRLSLVLSSEDQDIDCDSIRGKNKEGEESRCPR